MKESSPEVKRRWIAAALIACSAGGLLASLLLFVAPSLAQTPPEIQFIVPGAPRKWRVAIPLFRMESQDARVGVLSQSLPDLLARDLAMCGLFQVLPRDRYLADPQKEDWKGPEIDFKTWGIQGAEYLAKGLIQSEANSLLLEMRFFDVPTAYMMVGRRYSDSFDKDRMMVHDFANRALEALTQEMGVFDTKILYTAHKDRINRNRGEIWMSDLDGTNARQITRTNTLCLFPAWSPDGRKLAYASYVTTARGWMAHEIFVADVAGGSPTQLTRAGGMNTGPAWSPDGSQIAFAHSAQNAGDSDIYLMRADGSGPTQLTRGASLDVSPSWSPEGSKIVFTSDRMGKPDIFVMDANGSGIARLTSAGEQNQTPRWSPKGDKIVFCRVSGGVKRLYAMKADGSDQQQITNGPGSDEDPSWSPDGRMIAFGRSRGDEKKICVVPLTGDPVTPITDGTGREQGPAWSPRFKY